MALKSEKFVAYRAIQGPYKGHRFLATNESYGGDLSKLSLQDLIGFLQEKNIDPGQVAIPLGFKTTIRE